jgi:hypothetical protein
VGALGIGVAVGVVRNRTEKELAEELVALGGKRGAPAAHRVPNPWGRRGSPAHRARIYEAEQRFTARGWEVVAGGSLPEVRYGSRLPDLVLARDGKRIAFQVGRVTKAGRPIARERRALGDLRATGEFDNVYFLKYRP